MIRIIYKCRCTPKEVELDVPERPRGSDLMLWMTVVQAHIGMDHGVRSPHCMAEKMEYVKIPVDEHAEGVGEKPQLN